ncbi:hypothetical protein FIBSPDRAFT_955716 [Athelia psychrophila]|uniref:Uncharacterized protein n=1 Tax=Athelia psychrophila TaxID=1759441 RepID=A0A166HSE4_9AGAM|nr:hypothetical protein FIBSPDRAFT_955716 [Fibularhizoctonia sp. CBS 109695]
MPFTVSAPLITGRAGEGKTSSAKAVAQRVQIDPRVYAYTPYIELARHTETPIPTPKRLFKHSRGNAACRSSSVIAFDKVDQLLGVESSEIMDPPNKDARRNILMRIEKAPIESPPHFTLLAMQTEGYSATDLYNFVTSAMHQAAMRSTTPKDVDVARGDTRYPRTKHMQYCKKRTSWWH